MLVVFAPASALAAEAPTVSVSEPSSIGDTRVSLSGTVNPNGFGVAACRFEYGTTAAYGAAVGCTPPSLGGGMANVAVTAEIGALEPGTSYHFRLLATSVNGAGFSGDGTFRTTGSANCPNSRLRFAQGIAAIQLPNCMALEQVSPQKKFSQRAVGPMISADGERVAFRSLAPLAGTPGLLSPFLGDFYVANRGLNGWSTQPTSPPPTVNRGWYTDSYIARSFDPTLARWVVMGSSTAGSQISSGIAQLFRDGLQADFEPVSPLLIPVDGGEHANGNVTGSFLQAASADHTHLFFGMGDLSAAYLAGDPNVTPGFDQNIYLGKLDDGGLPSIELAARDQVGGDAGKVWGGSCGARVGGPSVGVNSRAQGAVSADGSQAYISTRADQAAGSCEATNKLRILKRTESLAGPDIVHLLPNQGAGECDRVAPVCLPETDVEGDGNDFFQGASVDGSKVYLTTNRQLSSSDLDGNGTECSNSSGVLGCDLYLYDANASPGNQLTQVSAGVVNGSHPTVGSGAGVFNGTVGVSGDGSRVYFAAAGVLTESPNPEGDTAADYPPADPKLYVWDAASEAIKFVGSLSSSDSFLWGTFGTFFNAAYPVPGTGQDGLGNEVGGDGRILVFQTKAALKPEDADGGRRDVYRYDGGSASPTLTCVSCAPGGPDSGPFDVDLRTITTTGTLVIPAGTAFAEADRWVSEDGDEIVLRTAQPLLPNDQNELPDDYLWSDGGLTLIPGATVIPGSLSIGESAAPAVLSHDGSEVGFTAYSALLKEDADVAPDVYVARVGGGFPEPQPEPVCQPGQNCQPAPAGPPNDLAPPSVSFTGKGNVKPAKPSNRCRKGKRKVVRNGKVKCVKRQVQKGAKQSKGNRNNGGQK